MKSMRKAVAFAAAIAMTMTSTTAFQTAALADTTTDWILYLPTEEGVTYDVDESKISEKYSTDDYKILLYREGEEVSLKIETDKEFSILDMLDDEGEIAPEEDKDGNVTFKMPDKDVCVAFTEPEPETVAVDASGVDAGSVKVVAGDAQVKIVMENGGDSVVEAGSESTVPASVDMLKVTKDGGFGGGKPAIAIAKDGEVQQDLSKYVVAEGGEGGTYTYDLKNSAISSDSAWTIVIGETGGKIVSATQDAPAETEKQSLYDEFLSASGETETEKETTLYDEFLNASGETETEAIETEIATEITTEATTEKETSLYDEFLGASAEETEAIETEAQTEAPTEIATEAPTEAQTEIATEAKTEVAADMNAMYGFDQPAENVTITFETEAETAVDAADEAVETEAATEAPKKKVYFTMANQCRGTVMKAILSDGSKIDVGKETSTKQEVASIVVEGSFADEEPTIVVEKNGAESDDGDVIVTKKILDDGNLFIEVKAGTTEGPDSYALIVK